ncbi:hypothetical protein AMS68_005075 [Peltaster fructicola]|uniref:OTU domain-containing protein n=1 Tax=Peltaster fructicola TaxID=286661 RepID=A0A6H0XY89_9PEZI|nr:hypothetical protein AMS68_005075 [Peltaster fructicola]
MGRISDDEFPLLSALGLYASDIRGDGNCLFNALSDQIFGDQTSHATIRARVIDYMRENASYYKQFIDVHPGGGIRRNPKRKNAGAYSTPANAVPPSEADVDRVFDSHLQSMARGGTYGDNMEITAFSSAYGVDVKIYQRDFAYMVTGMSTDDKARPVAHIAYHMWEHYSSIRNLEGPHKGLPAVSPRALTMEEEAMQQQKLAQTPKVLPWQIDVVSKSLPWLADKQTIKKALEAANGNVDAAVSSLLDEQDAGSGSSAQESSSIEREPDSDDEIHVGPNKRHSSRATRAAQRSNETRHALSSLAVLDGSQESVGSWEDSETSSLPDSSQQSTFTPASFDSSDSRSASLDTAPTRKPSIRLKLNPPRPPERHHGVGKTSLRQAGPRTTARDREKIKKQAQKAARKERQQAEIRSNINVGSGAADIRRKLTDTPPIEILKTLYI